MDLTDLEDPVVAKEFYGTTAAIDHNLYVKGRYMYQSNYVAGLRVVDVNDPVKPVEVGYFDTVPFGENLPGFSGSWSNYPYFKSGVVAVTQHARGTLPGSLPAEHGRAVTARRNAPCCVIAPGGRAAASCAAQLYVPNQDDATVSVIDPVDAGDCCARWTSAATAWATTPSRTTCRWSRTAAPGTSR